MGRKRKSISDRQLEIISTRVKPDVYKEIEKIALDSDASIAIIVRRFVIEGLRLYRKRAAA